MKNDKIQLDIIKQSLKAKLIGKHIKLYEIVDSTNIRAVKGAEKGHPDGSVYIAEKQTLGKGSRNRNWESLDGSIAMSILIRPTDINIKDTPNLTLLTGISVCNVIRRHTLLDAKIKWPNDIFIDNKKICGIIVKSKSQGEKIKHLVVGIGINVNNQKLPPDIRDVATSLFIKTSKTFDRNLIISDILFEFEKDYSRFLKGGFDIFLDEYKRLCIDKHKLNLNI